jgi:predicted nucleic acid-binding protein
MIYFDGCYIAKYYLSEPDSPAVTAAAKADGSVACSAHGKIEVAAVFHRKLREGSVSPAEFQLLRSQFEYDCRNNLWIWLPIRETLVDEAVRQFGVLSDKVFLRTGDAIHLCCAAEKGFTSIHSSDRHLLAAAPHFGLRGTSF